MSNEETIKFLQQESRKHDNEITEYVRQISAKQRRAAWVAIALSLLSIVLSVLSIARAVVD